MIEIQTVVFTSIKKQQFKFYQVPDIYQTHSYFHFSVRLRALQFIEDQENSYPNIFLENKQKV